MTSAAAGHLVRVRARARVRVRVTSGVGVVLLERSPDQVTLATACARGGCAGGSSFRDLRDARVRRPGFGVVPGRVGGVDDRSEHDIARGDQCCHALELARHRPVPLTCVARARNLDRARILIEAAPVDPDRYLVRVVGGGAPGRRQAALGDLVARDGGLYSVAACRDGGGEGGGGVTRDERAVAAASPRLHETRLVSSRLAWRRLASPHLAPERLEGGNDQAVLRVLLVVGVCARAEGSARLLLPRGVRHLVRDGRVEIVDRDSSRRVQPRFRLGLG